MLLCFSLTCEISFKLDAIYFSINKLIFLCIILDYKNLKFKYLINDVAINFLFFLKFCKYRGYNKNMQFND